MTTKLTTKIRTTPLEIPDSLKCNFDDGLCGWDTESDTIKWKNLDGDQSETYNSYGPGSDYTSTQSIWFTRLETLLVVILIYFSYIAEGCSFPFERNFRDYYYCSSVDSTDYYNTKKCNRKDDVVQDCNKGKINLKNLIFEINSIIFW